MESERLSLATLDRLPPEVARPGYDPTAVRIGVVHFGPGAFHRAHQARYFDQLLERDLRWGIAAVSLRTPGVTDALSAQDGLYSLSTLAEAPAVRVIGAHRDWIGPGRHARVAELLADPAVMLVTTTVTEKGYCLARDGTLDEDHPDIVHDRANPDAPRSIVGWLAKGLAARRAADVPPFGVLCCDNMTANGAKLRAAVIAFAATMDDSLGRWIAAEVPFPDTMVDSITPATDDAHLARTAARLGLEDAAAVQREPFTQWVVEDATLPGDPDLAGVGVIRAPDVGGFERAKLRVLNGAHSTLAYLGLALGHASVAEAMGDRDLAPFVEAMVRRDVVPTLGHVAGLDAQAYVTDVLDRFRNPGIRHLLSQIAWDGSQKLPYRILDTVADAHVAGRGIGRLAVPVAAWIAFVAARATGGETLTDPLADRLLAAAREANGAEALAKALLAIEQVFPPALARDPAFRSAVIGALTAIQGGEDGLRTLLRERTHEE